MRFVILNEFLEHTVNFENAAFQKRTHLMLSSVGM